jgi:penicillin amidase
MKWIRRSVGAVLLLALLAAALLVGYAQLSSPQTQGRLALAGLRAELRIERDDSGVPSIHAANLHDLAFGIGVVHAQDRLWQLETHRRIGSGRLAEAFGPPALETDRFLRALGVRRAAAAQWERLGGEAREMLLAYTEGVNAVRRQLKARPPEFILLGLPTEDWTPVDSLAWATMMAWDLGGNWTTELLRLRLALQMPVARINQLLPPYPGEQPLPTADYAALFRGLKLGSGAERQAWQSLPDIAPPSGVEGVGSNNWVVAGSHTVGGKPLLANDPHLKLSAPALWYFVRLDAPGLRVAGASMPGLPLVVLGQNEKVAWGFTNTGPDVQDLYVEQIKADDASQYRTPDGYARFESVSDVIKVKGGPDVEVKLRRTRHGPVISDAGVIDDVLGPSQQPAYALAMRWTALDDDIDAVSVGLAFMRAGSVAEFTAAARGWVAPMQNMVIADVEGHIGFVAPGRVPLRKPENDLKGQVPAPGWDALYDWAGFIPADETPREFDPPRGWIATANQRVVAPDYPYYLTNDWAQPYRHQRIEQVLRARTRHSIENLAALQADVKSLAAPLVLPWLQRAQSSHPLAAAAQRQLVDFDGTMAPDKAAPLIYWAWLRHLTRQVFEDDLGPALAQRLAGRSFRDALEGVLERNDRSWCDDLRTPAVETCAMQSNAAFGAALDELKARFGSDPAHWRWDAAHVARSEHRPFSNVKALARWFELRSPVGGDTTTVNVSRVSLRADATTGELYLDDHGPSLRALYDLGDRSQSRFMFSTGQSGLFYSPLYRNFVQPWTRVQYQPLWTDAPPAQVLVLTPS